MDANIEKLRVTLSQYHFRLVIEAVVEQNELGEIVTVHVQDIGAQLPKPKRVRGKVQKIAPAFVKKFKDNSPALILATLKQMLDNAAKASN